MGVVVMVQYTSSLLSQVVSVFENLHQGRILCSTMPHDNMLLTGGDSTVCIPYTSKTQILLVPI